MSAEPTRGRDHLDDVGADEVEPRGDLAAGPQQVDARHPARLGRARARRERRVEHVDVDREEDRPRADELERLARRTRRIPGRARRA